MTTKYQCSFCNHCFSSQQRLDYHITNKFCQKVNSDRECPTCKKVFTTKRRCQYHISHSVCLKQQAKPSQPKIHLKLKDVDIAKYVNMSHNQLIGELIVMKTKYETLKDNPQTVNQVNQVNQVNVFPTAYGKEDLKHIHQIMGDICEHLIKNHTFSSIPTLFNKIHNSQDLPEYHNVYVANERSNFAMVSDGKTFKFRPKKTIIDQVIEDKRSLLNQYIDENGDRLGAKVLEKYERYQDQIDDNQEFRKALELEIGGLLLDMKSVIANDEKTRQLLDKVDEGNFDLVPNS